MRIGAVILGAACFLAVALPGLVSFEDYLLYNAGIALIYVVLATGYNILLGLCGQLSMAQVAFFGLGGYASALLTRDLHWPWAAALLVAALLPTAGAWVIARAALRLTGPYLAMVTFAFHSALFTLFTNWVDLTNGWGGLSRIPPAAVAGFAFDTPARVYYLLLGFAMLAVALSLRLKASRIGRAMLAVRENRLAAKGAGIDTARIITIGFCLSGAMAGIAGSLHAHFVHYIDPTTFGLPRMVDLLIILIIGGRGSIIGVAVTAIAYVFALEYLRFLEEWKLMVFGALLIVMVSVSPDGLGALVRRLARTSRA